MTLANVRGLLFDFDGTLAPNLDLPDMRRQVIELTERARVPDNVFAGRYIVEIIDAAHEWLQHYRPRSAAGYHAAAHELITAIELRAARSTSPFPGVPAKLAALAKAGLRLGVVTRNCRAAVLQVFPDLETHVHALHARDDTRYLKPDPRHLLTSLETIGCRAEQTAMVGDGALDMRAGRQLDMYCIGVLSGNTDARTLIDAGAHIVIEDCLALAC